MNQSIQDLYRLFIKQQIELELENGNLISLDLLQDIINDIRPNRILSEELSNEIKTALIEYSADLLQINKFNFTPIRGLGIFNLLKLEENILDKYNWDYYQKHRSFLEKHVYPNNPNVVESIDYETDQIIKIIPYPKNLDKFSFRGLVIGHIQSGKTANFTHLISKLASVGYKFIVVLSGMTNALRQQTQYRIDRELTGNNTSNSSDPFVRWYSHESGYRQLTNLADPNTGYDGDFTIPLENFDHLMETQNRAVIAVVKKLARKGNDYKEFGSVIGKIILWITQSENYENVPIAIIDDEADQASVDNTTEDDEDPSVINHAIRVLLSKFNKSCYVGYTATPFANVFINPFNSTSSGVDDLYPKDLIYSLPKPNGYFGSSEFFNGPEISPYVVIVPDNEKTVVNETGVKHTKALYDSVQYFFFAYSIKRNRNDLSRTGMLVHTDHRNDLQEVVKFKILEALKELDNETIKYPNRIYESYLDYIQKSESILEFSKTDRKVDVITQNELILLFQEFKEELDIRVVNSRNAQLDYYREPLKTLICIGGNLMSRGLTIEGLVVTYYLRNSTSYDTLLQMARWFGYRSNYHELIRIFLTNQIYEQFEYISSVEEDLRAEVSRYIEEDLTPLDFAPKVRAHLRMVPSSRLGAAQKIRSYSRLTVQTHYLSRSLETINHNNEVTYELINSHISNFTLTKNKFFAKNIPVDNLVNFLKDFRQVNNTNLGINIDNILRYLLSQIEKSSFSTFSILVSSRNTAYPNAKVENISNFNWVPVIRSARGSGGWDYIADEVVNLGVISSSGDIPNLDDPEFTEPLLILYSIDFVNSNSFKKYNTTLKITENETLDNLNCNPKGFALCFPKSNIESDRLDYYQQIF